MTRRVLQFMAATPARRRLFMSVVFLATAGFGIMAGLALTGSPLPDSVYLASVICCAMTGWAYADHSRAKARRRAEELHARLEQRAWYWEMEQRHGHLPE